MNEPIILLGHGSQNPDAQEEFNQLLGLVKRLLPERIIKIVYLQLCQPDLFTGIEDLLAGGVQEVTVIPVFLLAGNHIRVDIPELLSRTAAKFPQLKIKLGRHLGPDPEIAKLIVERVTEVSYASNYLTNPGLIETESFRLIEQALASVTQSWTPAEREIVKRIVHTTADPGMAQVVDFHPQAISLGLKALRDGVRIITDVKMSLIGIGTKATTRFGCSVECYIDHPEVRDLAEKAGRTRAMQAVIKACSGMQRGIVVIGNAPTALFQLCEMVRGGVAKPDLIIGTPVGFVGAAESKEVLKGLGIPFIRTIGPRGGSPIAAAIVNALCKLAEVETGSPGAR